ncbi:MAG: immunoglobulin domain-containing protein [Limisphaerales bacterium]
MKIFALLLGAVCFLAAHSATAQPSGALSGRIIFMSGGHGWTNSANNVWTLQRPLVWEMIEDYGNQDQTTLFAEYCFRAGATVVPFRPVGHQTNAVIMDNLSAGVTFSGLWQHNTSEPVYYGAVGSGFHQASVSTTQTALATFTPNIPQGGFYPVYTWVPHGANRTNQLYRIQHTGGESLVQIPHHMVGNGWIYLGTYHFNAGVHPAVGSVQISNLQPGGGSAVVIVDAIRFGNGMSSSGSGQPYEDEGARLWIQHSLGQGQSSDIYSVVPGIPGDSDRTSRPKMAREMNREEAGAPTKRLYLSFHSNALDGNVRGAIALYNVTNANRTVNQERLAFLIGKEINQDMFYMGGQLETPWVNRSVVTLGGNFFEIDNLLLGGEMDATIAEVAFHDAENDAKLLRDPKARTWIARATYHGVLKYMNEFDGAPLDFLPEPPTSIRALARNGNIEIAWTPPRTNSLIGWGNPANYRVYISTNGYGFGNPIEVNASLTNVVISHLSADKDYYFRVTSVNAGGESLPSEVVGCRRSANAEWGKALFVNGFSRFDRTTNLRQTPMAPNYAPPSRTGTFERVLPRFNNSFDYVVQYGKASEALNLPFDSCHRDAITNGLVSLTNYTVVIWQSGQELRNNFDPNLQAQISEFLANRGNLFVSGSGIARELGQSSGPSPSDTEFLNNRLRANLAQDSHTNSGIYNINVAAGSIFAGNPNFTFDNGTRGIYWVRSPEILTPYGAGTIGALNYAGSSAGAAAVQYDGAPFGTGRVVYFGFPFETIVGESVRSDYMGDILNFLGAPAIRREPASTNVSAGQTIHLNVQALGLNQLSYQWRLNGNNLVGATASTYSKSNPGLNDAGEYTVVVSNSSGSITSAVANVIVNLPPTITAQPEDQNVVESRDVHFSVTATGTAPLAYQWFFNGGAITGATQASYSITNVIASQAGTYSVAVSNAVGSTLSDNATLIVRLRGTFSQPAVATNQLNLLFTGQPGTAYAIQTSTNLVHWSTVSNIFLTNGSATVTLPLTNQKQFYRSQSDE